MSKTTVIHIHAAPHGWRANPKYLYIGRPGYWGNPFPVNLQRSRGESLDAFREYAERRVREEPEFAANLKALDGLILVCFCKPQDCHGDILAEIAARLVAEERSAQEPEPTAPEPENTAPPMMACGHAANATKRDSSGKTVPVCVICWGIVPGADRVVEKPSLVGRTSKCAYRHDHKAKRGDYPQECPSDVSLPFFEYKPTESHDSHYCGCYGWD